MLIAADTNVLMDLAAEVESVVDTLGLVRQRVAGARWVVRHSGGCFGLTARPNVTAH